MARLVGKTGKASGGRKLNARGREWTKEDLRELKNHSREKTLATTISKSMKRTVAAVKRKAITLGLSLGRPVRKWTKGDLRELKSHLHQKTPVTTISKSMRRTVIAVRQQAVRLGLSVSHRR